MTLVDLGDAHLKQDRARRTRHDILLAAARTFERSGYSAARLNQIGEDASVTKGALYFHFSSKAKLARALVEAHDATMTTLHEQIAALQLEPIESIVALTFAVARDFRRSEVARAGMRLETEHGLIGEDLPHPMSRWIDHLGRLMRSAQQAHQISARVDCDAAANAIVASYVGIQEMSLRLEAGRDLIRRLRQWWSIFLPAVIDEQCDTSRVLSMIDDGGALTIT